MCVTELGVMRSIPSVHGGYVIMREEIYGVVLCTLCDGALQAQQSSYACNACMLSRVAQIETSV